MKTKQERMVEWLVVYCGSNAQRDQLLSIIDNARTHGRDIAVSEWDGYAFRVACSEETMHQLRILWTYNDLHVSLWTRCDRFS